MPFSCNGFYNKQYTLQEIRNQLLFLIFCRIIHIYKKAAPQLAELHKGDNTMENDITKESRKALKQIWETYSRRRKDGMSKQLAVRFLAKEYADYPDFETIRAELKRAGYLKVFIVDGDFDLTDKAIIFFENHDMETIDKWIDRGISVLSSLL